MFYQIALKISSAKRFLNKERLGKYTLDHTIYEFGGIRQATEADRTDCPDDTLPLHCVANAIAVLCGDRPVPAKRKHSPLADYPEFDHYIEMARRAHVRIDSIPDNKTIIQTVKASMYNLGSDGAVSCKQKKTSAKLTIDGVDYELKRGCPTHDSISMVWPREIYRKFDDMCRGVFGADYKSNMTFLDVLSGLRELYVNGNTSVCGFTNSIHFKVITKNTKKGPVEMIVVTGVDGIDCDKLNTVAVGNDFINPVKRGIVSGSIFRGETWASSAELKSWAAPVSAHGDPQICWIVNGMLYLKVTEAEAEAILKGPEAATILDGGTLAPVDSEGREDFSSLREVITRWDDCKESLPTPFEG